MADNKATQQEENRAAFKAGVRSVAGDAQDWNFVDKARPAGMNDVDYIGVDVPTEHGGLNRDTSRQQEVRMPVGDMNLKEIFAAMAGVNPAAIKRDIPGQTADYYREIGQHEGGHLHHQHGSFDGGLHDEINGDLHNYNGDAPEIEETLRDTRRLSALTNPGHATSPALPDAPGAEAGEHNSIKMRGAVQALHDMVVADLLSKGKIETGAGLAPLHRDHPEIVYESVKSLKDSGAFDDVDGSRGRYMRQYADDYISASEKWIKAPEPAAAAQSPAPASQPTPAGP